MNFAAYHLIKNQPFANWKITVEIIGKVIKTKWAIFHSYVGGSVVSGFVG
jgi:hypothetical protein